MPFNIQKSPLYTMSFFDKIVQKIFPKEEEMPRSEPLVKERITRSDETLSDYSAWENTGVYKVMLGEVWEAYQLKKKNEAADWQVHLLKTPYANGFALTYHMGTKPAEFQYFFDLLKDKILQLPYQLKNADRSLFDRKSHVEKKERYYLKPIIKETDANNLFDQQFGNILIEMIWIDDKPSYLKLVANIYSDRLYTEAKDFEDLMSILFEDA